MAGALLPASSNTAPNDSNVMTDESSEEDILAEGISTLNMYPRNAPRAESADLERSNAPHRRHGERYFGYTVQETHSTLAESNRKLKAQLEEMTRDRDSLACEIYEREQQHQKAVQQHESTAALTQNLKKHNKILQTENEDQKNQIVRYKKVISSSTRHADQVADDSIRQQANQIFFAIQDFAARNFRGVKFGMCQYRAMRERQMLMLTLCQTTPRFPQIPKPRFSITSQPHNSCHPRFPSR